VQWYKVAVVAIRGVLTSRWLCKDDLEKQMVEEKAPPHEEKASDLTAREQRNESAGNLLKDYRTSYFNPVSCDHKAPEIHEDTGLLQIRIKWWEAEKNEHSYSW
jgi:hypothetical protein